ncbi:aminotransferase class I/II-fold pyridoxal phosphate-dependent enzyme [Mycolicibacterium wolinskyi]|uniref:aminotransferase class I/II-fold pyridoxal phosphate-dependent enzyme n=1 Tax=Mycolicibacterium wolinskyi TaxID=59750 RepID=UPI003917816A
MSHPTNSDDGLSVITSAVTDRSSRGIASAVEHLIRNGALPQGIRLATVRRIARALEVSPATVSIAWTELRHGGWLHTDRRRGTLVNTLSAGCERPWSDYPFDEHLPDPLLLPSIDDAFAAAAASRRADHDTEAVEPVLLAAVTATWPFPAPRYTVANGGYEGTLLTLRATVRPGGAVAVESPTAPRILETLRAVRATAIPVRGDAHGPRPEALQQALFSRPDAVLYQPRSQVPTGSALTRDRIGELAAVLASAPEAVTVIEDDNIGPASSQPARTLAGSHPHRHVLIRSYCKAYGIDIRTCVISGPEEVVARIDRIRSLGMLATSRMLQGALAHLIGDENTERQLRIARRRHRDRRSMLAEELREHGVDARGGGDGLALWIPVHDERHARRELADHGIRSGSGAACGPGRDAQPHIWIGTGQLPDAPARNAELAALLAAAAHGRGNRLATAN